MKIAFNKLALGVFFKDNDGNVYEKASATNGTLITDLIFFYGRTCEFQQHEVTPLVNVPVVRYKNTMSEVIEYRNEYGQNHRLDGPAYEAKFRRHWYKNGARHRLDGPADEFDEYYVSNSPFFIYDVKTRRLFTNIHDTVGTVMEPEYILSMKLTPQCKQQSDYFVDGSYCRTYLEYSVAVEKYKQTQLTLA